MSDGITDGNRARDLDDILATGAAWITEKELADIGADVKFWRGQYHKLQRQHGELKAMFRANMLRATWPDGFDVNAEIDRVLAEIDK